MVFISEMEKLYFDMLNAEIDFDEEFEAECEDMFKMFSAKPKQPKKKVTFAPQPEHILIQLSDAEDTIRELREEITRLQQEIQTLKQPPPITTSECSICCCEGELIHTECCHNELCKDCTDKLGSCPFCRKIWDESKDEQIKHDILDDIGVGFDADDEPPPPNPNVVSFSFIAVLERLSREYKILVDMGHIRFTNNSPFPMFIDPLTNNEIRPSPTAQRIILDFILRIIIGTDEEAFDSMCMNPMFTIQRNNLWTIAVNDEWAGLTDANQLKDVEYLKGCGLYHLTDERMQKSLLRSLGIHL